VNLNATSLGAITMSSSGGPFNFGSLTLSGATINLSQASSATGPVSITSTQATTGAGITIGANLNASGQGVYLYTSGSDSTAASVINESSGGSITANSLVISFNQGNGLTATANLIGSNEVHIISASGSLTTGAVSNVLLNNGSTDLSLGTFSYGMNLNASTTGAITTSPTGTFSFGTLTLSGSTITLSQRTTASGAVNLTSSAAPPTAGITIAANLSSGDYIDINSQVLNISNNVQVMASTDLNVTSNGSITITDNGGTVAAGSSIYISGTSVTFGGTGGSFSVTSSGVPIPLSVNTGGDVTVSSPYFQRT
jgi:hypothetical protein